MVPVHQVHFCLLIFTSLIHQPQQIVFSQSNMNNFFKMVVEKDLKASCTSTSFYSSSSNILSVQGYWQTKSLKTE